MLSKFFETAIFRSELVAPCRDAMRLIDGNERDHGLRYAGQKFRLNNTFRRDVEYFDRSGSNFRLNAPSFGIVESATEVGCPDTRLHKTVNLILHQSNQRRDYKNHPLSQDCRKLITERFSSAGGNNSQGIMPLKNS